VVSDSEEEELLTIRLLLERERESGGTLNRALARRLSEKRLVQN